MTIGSTYAKHVELVETNRLLQSRGLDELYNTSYDASKATTTTITTATTTTTTIASTTRP